MFAQLFVQFLIVLIRCLPTLWVGWTAKTFVSWYYPTSKLGAVNPGSTVLNWVLWTGVACLVLMIGQGYAPDGSISKGLGNVQRFIFRIVRAGWNVTAEAWKESEPDATPKP